MATDLKSYEATINGVAHTFQLSDEDAVRRGLDPAKDAVQDEELVASPLEFGTPTTDGAQVEANVAAVQDEELVASPLEFGTPTTDGAQVEANVAADQAAADARAKAAADADAKARTASNKARTAADK